MQRIPYITRIQSPQGLPVCLIKMYGPSWDMAVVATAALTQKRGRVLCIENPLPVVPLQPLVGQFSIFGHTHSAQWYEVSPVW